MSSVPKLVESSQPVHRITSEEEALAVAHGLAAEFVGGASRRDYERALPYEELDRLSASGLSRSPSPPNMAGSTCRTWCWPK